MRKLLIIGAGGHGKVVAEIAEDIGYEEIAFLDDNSSEAIGKIAELRKFKNQFREAVVAIGDNRRRGKLLSELKGDGYEIPVLIHPTAYISKTAVIERGTVVEPRAIVNANTVIANGCIISVGSIVDHDVELKECCHINAGAIVKAGGKIERFRKLEAGEVVLGYESAIVNPVKQQ